MQLLSSTADLFFCILYRQSLNFFKGAVHSFSQYQHDGEKMKVLFQTFFLNSKSFNFFHGWGKKKKPFSDIFLNSDFQKKKSAFHL